MAIGGAGGVCVAACVMEGWKYVKVEGLHCITNFDTDSKVENNMHLFINEVEILREKKDVVKKKVRKI
jgi:hypothetical protein